MCILLFSAFRCFAGHRFTCAFCCFAVYLLFCRAHVYMCILWFCRAQFMHLFCRFSGHVYMCILLFCRVYIYIVFCRAHVHVYSVVLLGTFTRVFCCVAGQFVLHVYVCIPLLQGTCLHVYLLFRAYVYTCIPLFCMAQVYTGIPLFCRAHVVVFCSLPPPNTCFYKRPFSFFSSSRCGFSCALLWCSGRGVGVGWGVTCECFMCSDVLLRTGMGGYMCICLVFTDMGFHMFHSCSEGWGKKMRPWLQYIYIYKIYLVCPAVVFYVCCLVQGMASWGYDIRYVGYAEFRSFVNLLYPSAAVVCVYWLSIKHLVSLSLPLSLSHTHTARMT